MGTDAVLYGIIGIPTIVGLVQVLRQAGLPSRFAPVSAVLLGIIAGVLQSTQGVTSAPLALSALEGLTLGLSASGLYDVSGLTGASVKSAVTSIATKRNAP